MRSKRAFFPAIIALALLGAAAFFLMQNQESQQNSWKRLDALGGAMEVTVPHSWNKLPDLHANAEMQMGDMDQDEYMLVIREARERVPFTNLSDYSQFTRQALTKRLTGVLEFGPEPIEVGGMPGIRFDLRGTSDRGNQVAYIHASLQGEAYIYQVVLWTDQTRYQKSKSRLEKILQSFTEHN